MSHNIIVHKKRTNKVQVNFGYDVSADTITSEIRTQPDQSSPLIVAWDVDFVTDGVDGKVLLTIDDSSADIEEDSGYMDLKRVSGGEPFAVFDEPVEVTFRGSVTA